MNIEDVVIREFGSARQGPELRRVLLRPLSAVLSWAWADALLDAGRAEEARDWFGRAAAADTAGETDAAERFENLDTAVFEDLDSTQRAVPVVRSQRAPERLALQVSISAHRARAQREMLAFRAMCTGFDVSAARRKHPALCKRNLYSQNIGPQFIDNTTVILLILVKPKLLAAQGSINTYL